MNERPADDLTTSLKDLGESRASEHFTERVLEGLDRRLRRRARRRHLGIAAATVALVTLSAVGVLRREPPRAHNLELAQSRADEIRREHDLLIEELEELRRARELTPTVLYLGGDGAYDLVLDLNPLLDQMSRPTATPASTSAVRSGGAATAPRRQP